ncbi:signal recognition particle receptor subunit alpha homolog [Sitodiplosis mosellana]|uniref:signal recognition particle receptor subunit alpha homolog n=1 Tax=Sitodiplosis mosellana TaxID=263140 RepID=UPI002444BD5F|nr:signal recognition particle receptor subunit alpha homolog [Sitodiplosis mosellana]
MLDLFTIFTKGGIVLWCFRGTQEIFTAPVNALIRSVILQERTGSNSYDHNNLTLQYKLDNEFELIFVVAFQKILQLSYVDKFLSDIHLEFRDKYKNELVSRENRSYQQYDFLSEFNHILEEAEKWGRLQAKLPKQMRSFNDSQKSKKTVASMIERKDGKPMAPPKKIVKIVEAKVEAVEESDSNGGLTEDVLVANRRKLAEKLSGKKKVDSKKSPKTPTEKVKAGKQARVWDLGGSSKDAPVLDRSKDNPDDIRSVYTSDNQMIGSMKGGIQDLAVESESSSDEESEEDVGNNNQNTTKSNSTGKKSVFSMFSKFVGAKNLTREDMQTALDKLRDHLITKNVANYIANELCDSVAVKLEGKVLGTFDTIASTVKNALTEALVQILSPKRRIDILRDCLEAKKNQRPYVMAFCGVNGVGKSTNLAKICFWLIENNFNVLIAACDTFRAGAVEQLRTHMRHLNALHPPEKHGGRQMVQLYEKGYGKDAAGIAMEAIRFASDSRIDVVLVDTAGRMQDNEPLMRALTKLIAVNEPDLVLFVGEALVGNEAVDQLTKFNQALADHSSATNPHLIDGIVLTKFDTIDDKVGAAISMTYITGQPIVFVGTGQTYTDLKALNAKAVVHALMK